MLPVRFVPPFVFRNQKQPTREVANKGGGKLVSRNNPTEQSPFRPAGLKVVSLFFAQKASQVKVELSYLEGISPSSAKCANINSLRGKLLKGR